MRDMENANMKNADMENANVTAITGKMHVFGNNIDTDQICPGVYLELTRPEDIAAHCLEGADRDFVKKFQAGDIVVGGTNFGCGSSREHAAISLKTIGVSAVVAKSFARIFYRNGINLGLMLLICPEIDQIAEEGEELVIDLENWTITNKRTKKTVACEAVSDYMWKILKAGGIKNLMR